MQSEHKQSAHMYRDSQYSGTAPVPLAVYNTLIQMCIHVRAKQPYSRKLTLGVPVRNILSVNFLKLCDSNLHRRYPSDPTLKQQFTPFNIECSRQRLYLQVNIRMRFRNATANQASS